MAFDPEDVLGTLPQTDPGKGAKKSSPGFDPSDVKASMGPSLGNNLIAGTIDPNTNFSDFRFQPKTNADNYLLRAQDQGFWESLGKTIGNVAANIPLDIVQGVGYLGTMLEFGDDRDYTNALVEGIEKLKNPLGDVYQEHPNETIDMSDSAWWMNNLGGLVESAASFAVEGAGVAKLFGTLAKGAAWSARAGKLASQAAQGLSAATLTYMEGAMSGANVFETAYNNNYMKMIGQGIDATEADQQAKHIASQAAAATVQLHTVMNLGLNLTALSPLFRDPDQAIVRWWRQNGAAQPGESSSQWAARIAEAAPDGMPLKKLLGLGMQGPSRLGLEAFQEGLEEVNTQYAEHVGKSIGEGKEKKDIAGQLTDAERYFKEVLNEEGALNMALGALGGIAQTAIMDHIPVHNVVKYGADGKPLMTAGQPQTERVSSHTMNERMNRQYFDNIKDALSKDMEWFGAKNKEMEDALRTKDLAALARVKAEMLSVHNLRAISMGLGDVWKQQYADIAGLDNTRSIGEDTIGPAIQALDAKIEEARQSGDLQELDRLNREKIPLLRQKNDSQGVTEAMQKGYAQDKSDNAYKERAIQASQTLDSLTKLYEDMHDKYTGTPELDQSGLADHMFYRQASLQLHKQQLDHMEQDLLKLRARVDEMTLSPHDDMLVKQAHEFLADKEVWDGTVKKLNNDIARINDALKTNNTTVFLKMLEKYKIPATPGAGKQLVETLERRKEELQKRSEATNKDLNDTIAVWQEVNPGKQAKDVIQKASERPVLEDVYKQNKAYHQQGLTEYEVAREQLAKDSTNAGIQKFLKENKPADNKKKIDKEHIDAYNQQLDREIAANMDAKQKQALVTKTDNRITEVQKLVADNQRSIASMTRDRQQLKGFKNSTERAGIKRAINQLQAENHEYEFELNHLIRRRQALSVQATTATTQAQNVPRTPPVTQPARTIPPAARNAVNAPATVGDLTPTVPGITLAQVQAVADKYASQNFNYTHLQDELNLTDAAAQRLFQAYVEATSPNYQNTPQSTQPEYNEELPDFDFSQEITPAFTNLQEGHSIFDGFVGGSEAGNTIRQFIKLRKTSEVEFLENGIKTMIQKTNLPMPTEQDFKDFITPYVTELKNSYLNEQKNPEEEYETLKSFLKPDVLTVLDILEGEFREHGFSYDRTIQVLNQQVKEKNLAPNLVGMIANQMKAYIEFKGDPIIATVRPTINEDIMDRLSDDILEETVTEAPIAPVQPAITSTPKIEPIVQEQILSVGSIETWLGAPTGNTFSKTVVTNDGGAATAWGVRKRSDGKYVVQDVSKTNEKGLILRPESYIKPLFIELNQGTRNSSKLIIVKPAVLEKQANGEFKLVEMGEIAYDQVPEKQVEPATIVTKTKEPEIVPTVTDTTTYPSTPGRPTDADMVIVPSNETIPLIMKEIIHGKHSERPVNDEDIRNLEWSLNHLRTDIPLWHAVDYARQGPINVVQVVNKLHWVPFVDRLVEFVEGQRDGTITTSLMTFLYLHEKTHVSKEFNEDPNTFIAPTTDSEPTVFSNAALDLEQVNQQSKVFVGASNVEAVKANFNTHPYKEFDNGSQIRIVADYTQLDPKLNTDVLIPGVISAGDQVIFEVDENWSGEINYDTEMVQDDYGEQLKKADMFQNYLENPDRIGMASSASHPKGAHANVPIKIIHQTTGKVIGYLPRADWILAKYPDTGNYRNVVDEYKDDEIDVTDNVIRQYGRIIKLREAVVNAWNTDKSLKLSSSISKRGTGHTMINRETNPNTGRQKLVSRSAKNMLPDSLVEIAIIKQGSAYVASGIQSQKQLARLPRYMQDATSLPVALLPAPDGTFVPTPLYTHRLGDNPSSMNTVVSAIEFYLRSTVGSTTAQDAKAIARIKDATGFDIRQPGGLRNFIQQYFTYTQKFGEKDTVITPSEAKGNAAAQFMLDIPDLQPGETASFIKVGTSFSGEKPMYAQLVNGELHPDFEQALRDGLANRFKSVIFAGKELRGINTPGEFKAPIIKKDGTVQVNTYQDYNEFVKASSTTFAYGLNKVGDKYVYMANPVIQLDYEGALKTALPVVNTTLTQEAPGADQTDIQEFDELADLFGNGILSPSPSSVTPMPIPSQGEQVSLQLLEDLRNLTPEAHRNTKMPETVLRELLEKGITVLADGHNPFYTC